MHTAQLCRGCNRQLLYRLRQHLCHMYRLSVAAVGDLMPAVRKAPADALIVADGTSCRHQIADGANRQAVHVAEVLAQALM